MEQVFRELVAQRLSQGFQIITMKKSPPASAETALSSSPQYQHTSKLIRARPRSEQQVKVLPLMAIPAICQLMYLDLFNLHNDCFTCKTGNVFLTGLKYATVCFPVFGGAFNYAYNP